MQSFCVVAVGSTLATAALPFSVIGHFATPPRNAVNSVRGENQDLFVSDVGISPRLSAEQYGEIFEDIANTLSEVLDEQPEASDWLRGRTFARTLH